MATKRPRLDAASLSRERALARLHAEIRRCQRCPLWATRTQAVPGIGPADASVVLIGEAPGRREDLQGEPFVGLAGRVLDALLHRAGLRRGDVYITNVVKSRPFIGPPPGRNRAPSPEEIAACRSWLDDQLRLIRPRIIVAMGRVSLDCVVPGAKISAVHGRPVRRGDRVVLPLYHPAVAVRRRDLRQVLERDILTLRVLLREARPQPRTRARGRGKERSRRVQNTPS